MRSLIVSLMAGAAMAVPLPGVDAAPRQQASPPAAQQGLCRRAAPPPPLPPEPKFGPESQQRWERRSSEASMPGMPTPPPPPPMPAPPPAPPVAVAEASSGAVVVTGARASDSARAKSTSPTAVDSVTAEDVGALPGLVAPAPPAPTAPGSAYAPRVAQPRAGLLTAGDHDDLLNPELYARYVDDFLRSETLAGVPRVDTRRVLTIAVRDDAGRPVPFAPVTLTCADGNSLTLATLADGTAVFFPELDRLGSSVRVSVPRGGERRVSIDGASGQQMQALTVASSAAAVRSFDLAVVIDTTGSMGDELEYLKAELLGIVGGLQRRHPGLDIRLALIPYRDKGDAYVTVTHPFTKDLGSIQASMRRYTADGGGDYPEAVEQAMARAMTLGWRPNAVKSLLLVADAPPHAEDVAATWAAAEWARSKRIQIVPVAASGVADGAEYLMRAMAAATQSRYLFLTDDSGIGNPHAPPAIDCYLVTKLDALIRRTLDSQIAGRRVEPDQGEVIRSVGTSDRGKCVLPPDFGGND